MSKEKSGVVISGSVAKDHRIIIEHDFANHLPSPLPPDFAISFLIKEFTTVWGGTGANMAHMNAALGGHPILLGSVGKEDKGYIDQLHDVGVNTQYIHLSDRPTAQFFAKNDIQRRLIGSFYPGAMEDSSTLSFLTWVGEDIIAVVAPHDPNQMRRQIEECRDNGIQLFFDLGQQINNTDLDLLRMGQKAASIMALNRVESETLEQRLGIPIQQIKNNIPVFITTLGGDGVDIEGTEINERIHVDAVKPKQINGTIGAGDAFRGGLLRGRSLGYDWETSAKIGCLAATYVLESVSGQPRIDISQFEQRFHFEYHEEIHLADQNNSISA